MTAPADQHAADHAADHEDFQESGHFTLRGYLTGFLLSAALTALPFALVMRPPALSTGVVAAVIILAAIAQILVHSRCFLHVNARAQGGWALVSYVFTGVIVAITIGGSLWIMYHLNSNMMPGMMADTMDAAPSDGL